MRKRRERETGAKWKEGWVYSGWPDRQHQAPPHLKLSLFSTSRGKILEKKTSPTNGWMPNDDEHHKN